MNWLTRERLIEILHACSSLRVGVVGDFNLDAYWHADMTRSTLSRETPLFPRPVFSEKYSGGGAANVAWNLAALGVREVQAFTVLGRDWRGDLLARFLEKVGVKTDAVLWCEDWKTPLYGKVILNGYNTEQEDARIDFVNDHPLPVEVENDLFANIEAALPGLDALIIADYQAIGVLSNNLRSALNRLAKTNPAVCFVADSRDHIASFTQMVIKPNEVEASRMLFPEQPLTLFSLEELQTAGLRLNQATRKPIIITLGERGCLLLDQAAVQSIPAVEVGLPSDPVGAGDTFLAILASCMAAGSASSEACMAATLAAAVTVRQLRVTGTASQAQILAQYDQTQAAVI